MTRQNGISRIGLAALALMASGCASSNQKGQTGVDRAVSKTSAGFSDAAMTPLTDVNLRRVPIPARLEAIRSPYEPVKSLSCLDIGKEVDDLTAILGPDVDAPQVQNTMNQKVGDAAGQAALNGVAGAVTDFIPYRSLIRTVSGASEHERRLRAAYEKGAHRRTYLKGIGSAQGCGWPAAPDPRATLPPERATIEYRAETPGDGKRN